MRRVARHALNALTALSLLLCVATVALWVRSYWVAECWSWSDGADRPRRVYRMGHRYDVALGRGHLYVTHDTSWWFPRQFRHLRLSPDAALAPFVALRSFAGFQWGDHVGTPLAANVPVAPFRLYRVIGVPCWALSAAGLILPVVRRARRRRLRRGLARALCRSCGYDLTGNVSGVCPECGTKVEVA